MSLDLMRDLRIMGKILDKDGNQGNNQSLGVDSGGLLQFLSSGGSPLLNFSFARRITNQTVTGGFVEYLKLTTPSLPAGDYILLWMFMGSTSTDGASADFQIQIDDAVNVLNPAGIGYATIRIQNNNDRRVPIMGFDVISLGAGVHDIDLDHANIGSGNFTIYNAIMAIWRIS